MELDCCRSTSWGLRIAQMSEQQREAHVDISYNDDYIICAKSVPNQRRHNHGYLHPIGHLSLLGSWHLVKSCEVSTRQNKTLYKRLSNMSANPPPERHTPRRESTMQRYKKNFILQTTEWSFLLSILKLIKYVPFATSERSRSSCGVGGLSF